MATESMVALALATALLVAWYASTHRAEDKDRKDRHPGKLAG